MLVLRSVSLVDQMCGGPRQSFFLHLNYSVPLDACQDCGHVVCRTPSVLQNVETQFAGSVYVGVEHLADEFDLRWLVGVLLFELHNEAERSILERSIGWSDDDCIPILSVRSYVRGRGIAAAAGERLR